MSTSRPKRSKKAPQFLADYATREEQHEAFQRSEMAPAVGDSPFQPASSSSSSSSSPSAAAALAPADPLEQKQGQKLAPIFSAATSPVSGSSSGSTVEQQLRVRILQLEAQLAQRDAEIRSLKRQKRSLADAAVRPDPAKKPKTGAQKRKLFEKWAKSLKALAKKTKTQSCGWGSYGTQTMKIKESTLLTPDQFEDMFSKKGGVQTQPTPNNKPQSIITIVDFKGYEAVAKLFGGEYVIPQDGYLFQVWRSRAFVKSYKVGTSNQEIRSLTVEYHTKNHALTLKFELGGASSEEDEDRLMFW